MDALRDSVSGLPASTLAILGVLVVVQLTLQVLAVLDIVRRPEASLLGGRKWVWLLVVVLGEILGAIAYFAAARRPMPAEDALDVRPNATGFASDRAAAAADALYGARGEEGDDR